MRVKPRDGGKHHIRLGSPKLGAQTGPRNAIAGEVLAMHAQGNDGKHGPRRRRCAKPLTDIAINQIDLCGHRGLHGARGADHRIPRHHRGHAQIKQPLQLAEFLGNNANAVNWQL